MIIFFKYFKNF